MKIIIDAMSGDNAPQEIVAGAVKAADELGVEIVFVGRESEMRACLGSRADAFPVINADDVITMETSLSFLVHLQNHHHQLSLLNHNKVISLILAYQ